MCAACEKWAYLSNAINNRRGQLMAYEKCRSQQWRERSWWEREGEGIVHTEWQHGLFILNIYPALFL